MHDKLKTLFTSAQPSQDGEEPDQERVAVAALLVEAAKADEEYIEAERRLIDRALQKQFSLSAEEAAQLRTAGEAAQADAIDIHRFTKHAKRLDLTAREALIETMWSIVLVDGDRDQFEDAFIRRLCGLLHVDDRASGEARERVLKAKQG